jgi:hypothetical protein
MMVASGLFLNALVRREDGMATFLREADGGSSDG